MLQMQLKTNYFLTRALAAYAVYYLSQAEVDLAAKSITDGYDDNGIDRPREKTVREEPPRSVGGEYRR
jgi:hypothetical protein